MDTFDREQLNLLLASEGGPHVSVFLPVPESPFDAKDDRIRLSNLIRQARSTLTEHWMPESEADDFLMPLMDLAGETEFISGRRHGTAIFLAQHFFKVYPLAAPAEQRLFISRAFMVRPMLESVHAVERFFLLTLSKKRVALYAVTQGSISEVELLSLPASFEETLVDVSADRGAQTHSAATAVTGKQGAVFHGQGGKPDSEKSELTEYLKHVDDVVGAYLQDHGGFLILAGVDYLTAMYRQINSCPRLIDATISGNVDHLSQEQLQQQSAEIAVEELRRAPRSRRGKGSRTATQSGGDRPGTGLVCRVCGRIDTLFFDKSATLYGSFFPDSRTLKKLHHPATGQPDDPSHDLIEMAAVQTLRHSGDVYSVSKAEMPVDANMAAALRY